MLSKTNWDDTKRRFTAWWNRENIDRPLMQVVARKKVWSVDHDYSVNIIIASRDEAMPPEKPVDPTVMTAKPSVSDFDEVPLSVEALYTDVPYLIRKMHCHCENHIFLAESFPNFSVDLGPGSIALYLGSEPVFAPDTVWFTEFVEDWNDIEPIRFNPDNKWWKTHLKLIHEAKEMAGEDFLVNIPDLIENVDILSAMRGPQPFCYDLVDEPEQMKRLVDQLDDIYFTYYDAMYDLVKLVDGSVSYTAFQIWGPGKTAKIQCDFCALMSPVQFRQFVQPSLRRQCQTLDHSLYHLDGPDAIKHVDALMEIEELDAVQWTAGAGQPDGGNLKWYPIYDKVIGAGKCMWISIYDGDYEDWVASAENLVKRYGSKRLFLLFPIMEEVQAEALIAKADSEWVLAVTTTMK